MQGHIYRRRKPDGAWSRWRAVIDLPVDGTGGRRQKTTTHDTKRDAQAWLARITHGEGARVTLATRCRGVAHQAAATGTDGDYSPRPPRPARRRGPCSLTTCIAVAVIACLGGAVAYG